MSSATHLALAPTTHPETAMQTNRIDSPNFGYSIDAARTLKFSFDGRQLSGFAGDTVASALLANDIHLVARSIKFHRPRGILSCGLEEPSALVECTKPGSASIPNLKATEVPLSEGLIVRSQNNWPSRNFDVLGALSLGSRFLKAGFYYKTFMWPQWGWHRVYERIIRRFAGIGRIKTTTSPTDGQNTREDQRNKFCEILIIGSGPAGLNAALTCARQGLNVVLIEQDSSLGGSLLWRKSKINDVPTDRWLLETLKNLKQYPNLTVLTRTLAFGHHDHGLVLAYQSSTTNETGIFWKVRAQRILLASGAIERPLVFPNNDRPGIMLASAVRAYLNRYAVKPGQRAFIAITDDQEKQELSENLTEAGIEIVGSLESGQQIIDTSGRQRIRSISIKTPDNLIIQHRCDLVCISGGWTPVAHLAAHVQGGLPVDKTALSPAAGKQQGPLLALGGTRGVFELAAVLQDSESQAIEAMLQLGVSVEHAKNPEVVVENSIIDTPISATGNGPAFIDFQNDVTRADLIQALDEGYRDIELVKRYTTTGMGTDQGKTSWVNSIAEIAALTGSSPAELGHTTFRPPYSPVSFAGLAGARTGQHLSPIRRTPLHRSLEKLGCVFQTSGEWLYSRYFPQKDETLEQAVEREVKAVRTGVGFIDMSTLGKFEVKGRDAETFLSRLYCNSVADMPVGKVRYGLMLREDGIVFDDGTVARLGIEHYVVTATTANVGAVWRWMTRLAQIQWADLEVILTNVSERWAAIAIAGPKSRELLSKLDLGIKADKTSFPFASVQEGVLHEQEKCRVYAVSYSGEMCFEVNIPAGYAGRFVKRLLDVGAEFGITPYGLETLDVLRIEKGHLSVGREIDGRTTPHDLGLEKLVSKNKDFLGRTSLGRPGLHSNQRLQLVGLVAVDKTQEIPPGGVIVEESYTKKPQQSISGWLTAAIYSPTLEMWIALALLRNGRNRHGEQLWVASPIADLSTQVRVGGSCFYDIQGTGLHA